MREILFKAKSIRETNCGEWVEGYYVKNSELFQYIAANANTFCRIASETLCQYTETPDMYYNKIWENDIVKYDDEYGYVEWQESAFVVVFNGWQMNLSEFMTFDLEVYGNVFDNPELLEVEE